MQWLKSYGQNKYFIGIWAISFVFWAHISTCLKDPFWCSDLVQIFFGGSPMILKWDKTVAELKITFFGFLNHPKGRVG